MDRQVLAALESFKRCLDGLVTTGSPDSATKRQYKADMTQVNAENHGRNEAALVPSQQRTGDNWYVSHVATHGSPFPFIDNLTTLMLIVACDLSESQRERLKSCDRRLARLISYIHHASDYLQKCHVDSTAQHCRLGLFQDSDFAEDLEHSKSISGGVWVFLVLAHLCLLAGCAKNKHQNHTVLPHPKFYRWMLGFEWAVFPALDLWDVVLDVLRSTHGDANSNVANSRETGARPTIRPKPKQTKTTRNISK